MTSVLLTEALSKNNDGLIYLSVRYKRISVLLKTFYNYINII